MVAEVDGQKPACDLRSIGLAVHRAVHLGMVPLHQRFHALNVMAFLGAGRDGAGSLAGMSEVIVPVAFEPSAPNPQADIFNRLLKSRIVMLGTDVNDDMANQICAQLLFLDAEEPGKDIWMYINSPGGSVTAGMAIYDTMQFVGCDVATVCLGLAASMGQFLLCAGAAGQALHAAQRPDHDAPAARPACAARRPTSPSRPSSSPTPSAAWPS